MGGPAAEAHRMRLQSFEACVAPQHILDGQKAKGFGFGDATETQDVRIAIALVMHHAFPVRDLVRRNL